MYSKNLYNMLGKSRQTDGKSDPCVVLCFVGDIKTRLTFMSLFTTSIIC